MPQVPTGMAVTVEHFWVRRTEAEAIRTAASKGIREPPDPAVVFREALRNYSVGVQMAGRL